MVDNVTPIDDFAEIEQQAADELRKEAAECAKKRIKISLKKIADAKKIVANCELEHKALLDEIRAGE